MKHLHCLVLVLNLITLGFINGNPIPEVPEAQLSSTTSTTSAPALGSTADPFDTGYNEKVIEEDLNELQGIISPKLFTFLQRLALIDPGLLQTGEARLASLKLMGRDEVDEIIGSGNQSPEEIRQFKSDLAKVTKLVSKYPEIGKLIQISFSADHEDAAGSTLNPVSAESFLDEVDPFFDEFTRIDKELSKYPEWNRYWTYWFKRYGDYMAKHG